jgi:hypothetical protein
VAGVDESDTPGNGLLRIVVSDVSGHVHIHQSGGGDREPSTRSRHDSDGLHQFWMRGARADSRSDNVSDGAGEPMERDGCIEPANPSDVGPADIIHRCKRAGCAQSQFGKHRVSSAGVCNIEGGMHDDQAGPVLNEPQCETLSSGLIGEGRRRDEHQWVITDKTVDFLVKSSLDDAVRHLMTHADSLGTPTRSAYLEPDRIPVASVGEGVSVIECGEKVSNGHGHRCYQRTVFPILRTPSNASRSTVVAETRGTLGTTGKGRLTMSNLVEAGTYESVLAARVASAVLESVGIESHIVTDNAGGAIPSLSPLSGGVRLLVRDEDQVDAIETLDIETPFNE